MLGWSSASSCWCCSRSSRRAPAEPILPLDALPQPRRSASTSAIGFIVGFALFGAVTYLPLYLQIVKGQSPTQSGLLLTPLMAGVLVTSIVSGNADHAHGRYRPFPIVGTAMMTVADVAALAARGRARRAGTRPRCMIVLGLGLGMVMQVLVLAVQNAVDYRHLGVATSGSTLFRQIGGSIGVAVFGAIFANRLADELAARLPRSARADRRQPGGDQHLPPALHGPYVEAFAASLHPVFLVASGISLVGFVLTWRLRDVPLRGSSRPRGWARPSRRRGVPTQIAGSSGSRALHQLIEARSITPFRGGRAAGGRSTVAGWW